MIASVCYDVNIHKRFGKVNIEMISFKDYLVEGRDAPLYHATGMTNFFKMIKSGSIEPKTQQRMKKLLLGPNLKGPRPYDYLGVSTTRSFPFAVNWTANGSGNGQVGGTASVILQFDQRKLSQDFKIVPISFFQNRLSSARTRENDMGYNEYEEFIITNKPINISKYVTRVFLNSHEHSAMLYKEGMENYDINPGTILRDMGIKVVWLPMKRNMTASQANQWINKVLK